MKTGVLIALIGSGVLMFVTSCASPNTKASPPIDLSRSVALAKTHADLVVDYGDGVFHRIRGFNIVTFVTASNADRSPPRPTEIQFYEHLLFGERLDNKRDKTDRSFRLRITDSSLQKLPAQDFVARFECAQGRVQIGFEHIGDSLVSLPFIVVEQLKEPRVEGVTEVHYDMYRPPHNQLTYQILVRRSP